jgi:hypothetical protein
MRHWDCQSRRLSGKAISFTTIEVVSSHQAANSQKLDDVLDGPHPCLFASTSCTQTQPVRSSPHEPTSGRLHEITNQRQHEKRQSQILGDPLVGASPGIVEMALLPAERVQQDGLAQALSLAGQGV